MARTNYAGVLVVLAVVALVICLPLIRETGDVINQAAQSGADTASRPVGGLAQREIEVEYGETHSRARGHTEAEGIRQAIKKFQCLDMQHYYSFSNHTLLTLCQKEFDVWGGLLLRVTETRYGRLWYVGYHQAVPEVTCYDASWSYWSNVLNRDGYRPISSVTDPTLAKYLHEVVTALH